MELADNSHISDFVKKTLAQFGWKDGDAIPVELGPMLVALKERSPKSPRNDVLIDINVVNKEDAEQITNLLAEAKKVAKSRADREAADAEIANMHPGLAEVYKKLQAQEAETQIIDDREEVAAANNTPPADTKTSDAPAPTVEPDATGANSPMLMMPFCQRCGYDNRQPFDTEVTDLDKQDFLASILGNVPFKRDYEIMGGNIKLTFHTPLAEENKMLHRQLVLDQQAGKIVTEAEWFVQMMEYRMALSLESLTDKSGRLIAAVPSLKEYEAKAEKAPIVSLHEHVTTTVLSHEVTRRLVGTHLRRFQRLVEALEAMALEPSFWNGIESQR